MRHDKRDLPVFRVTVNGNPYEVQARFACDAIIEAIEINKRMTGKQPRTYIVAGVKTNAQSSDYPLRAEA